MMQDESGAKEEEAGAEPESISTANQRKDAPPAAKPSPNKSVRSEDGVKRNFSQYQEGMHDMKEHLSLMQNSPPLIAKDSPADNYRIKQNAKDPGHPLAVEEKRKADELTA